MAKCLHIRRSCASIPTYLKEEIQMSKEMMDKQLKGASKLALLRQSRGLKPKTEVDVEKAIDGLAA